MKKYSLLLALILLMTSAMGTVVAENEKYTYLAFLTRFPPNEAIADFIEGWIETDNIDISQSSVSETMKI